MKTTLVRNSTNPHYVDGDIKEAVEERNYTNKGACTLVTSKDHHDDIKIPISGKKEIGFVQTENATGELRRIAD